MTDLHKWEEVYSTKRAIGGFATIVSRFGVPGGWIYIQANMRFRWFRRDEVFYTSVFVPDLAQRKET